MTNAELDRLVSRLRVEMYALHLSAPHELPMLLEDLNEEIAKLVRAFEDQWPVCEVVGMEIARFVPETGTKGRFHCFLDVRLKY